MVLAAADALLTPVTTVDGFVLGCLVDASTGMVITATQGQDQQGRDQQGRYASDLPAVAADATDIARLLGLLSGYLAPADRLEDVIVTRSDHLHLIRPVPPEPGRPAVLLLVVLERSRANLALARGEVRLFCEGLTG